MDRTVLTQAVGIDGPGGVMTLIENGEEARRIYNAIAEAALKISGVNAAAIMLSSDRNNNQHELIAGTGDYDFSELLCGTQSEPTLDSKDAARQLTSELDGKGYQSSFEVICLGAPVGALICISELPLPSPAKDKLMLLAHHTSVVFERQRLSNTLQHFLDRLQVLTEINQLIAGNVGLQRVVKSLARESAFRFAADIALTFILSEDKTTLEVKGGYGCAPHLVPKIMPADRGVLGQAVRVGGHLSISNLATYPNHMLDFVKELEIKSADICCLEVRGEALGIILIGYKHETSITPSDLTRFEEFCQGAAVAIANARTQERIQSYTERLEELVETRTSDLAVQTSRAEEANHAKSQFLANMSHELRTPLTAIVGYSSVIADGIFGPLNDKQRDALNAITRSSDHLKNLIDDVLNLARIESGKEQAEPTRVAIKELLTQAQKLMMQTAIGKGITLQPITLSEEIQNSALWVDAKHVHQILINMMSNAIKYTPRGGKVWIDAVIASDKIRINVHDTGVGIPPDRISKLFERFERGEDAYSKNQEGTGIGLNLTQHLVELNGGRIGAESVAGEGSTFWILLPLASDKNVKVTQTEAVEPVARLDGLTVLVVDDNHDTCEVLLQVLQSAGATVKTANTVRDAVAALELSIPDIVLTDLAIPGESGVVLIEHIRNSHSALATLPIIVLSACAFESDRQQALKAGGSIFIPKPFRPSEIIKAVRHLTLASAMRTRSQSLTVPTLV